MTKKTASKKKLVKKKTSSKKAKKSDNGNGIADVLKDLWEAAVSFRGSIEPSDYKRYFLPIIFLRFLSLKYERRNDELASMIKDPKSDYHTTNKKVADQILEDPDEYRSANVFVVPKKARWAHILKHAGDDDIKIQLDDALELLEDTYAEKLRFDDKMKRLTKKLGDQFAEAARLETEIRSNLESIGYGI